MNDILPELTKMFAVFNKEFFAGRLSTPKFGVEANRNHPFRYDLQQDTLFIGNGSADLGLVDFQSAFLHELVHVCNAQNGVSDLTANQYHNGNFLELALEVGLICIRHKNQGWSITTTVFPRNVVESSSVRRPTDEAHQHRQEVFRNHRPASSVLRQFRLKIKQSKETKTSKTFFLKYVCGCPPPHNSIRSGRRPDGANPLRITCRDCGQDFVCDSQKGD